jgi:1-acyl-sn-glycerol-3-phosphate acyltransferase
MTSTLSAWILKLFGWKTTGKLPDVPKYVCLGGPHTSNWDFILGVLARSAMKFDAKFLGKASLFKPPYGWLFRWLGGVPVTRTKAENNVQASIRVFNEHEKFILALAPEGTRKLVPEWRTGFWYIAKGAGVPIVPICFDFENKEFRVHEAYWPTDDFDADMEVLSSYYVNVKGRNPELNTYYKKPYVRGQKAE